MELARAVDAGLRKGITGMIEYHFNVPFVAALALREKQIQQNYRPVIAVHKWVARRPGALFRALILSEFSGRPVNENYYHSHHLPHCLRALWRAIRDGQSGTAGAVPALLPFSATGTYCRAKQEPVPALR